MWRTVRDGLAISRGGVSEADEGTWRKGRAESRDVWETSDSGPGSRGRGDRGCRESQGREVGRVRQSTWQSGGRNGHVACKAVYGTDAPQDGSGEVGGKDYSAVHMSINRLEGRVREDRKTRKTPNKAARRWNVEMSTR